MHTSEEPTLNIKFMLLVSSDQNSYAISQTCAWLAPEDFSLVT